MTEQQVKDQLKRLVIFGNLKETEFTEYYNALCNIGYTQLLSAITWLINNHEKHSVPLPSEIIKAIKQTAFDESQQKNSSSWGTCGTLESNVEFWRAWHMVAMTNKSRWQYYYTQRLGRNAPIIEGNIACEYYRSVQDEIKKELNILPKQQDRTETNTYDYPF